MTFTEILKLALVFVLCGVAVVFVSTIVGLILYWIDIHKD